MTVGLVTISLGLVLYLLVAGISSYETGNVRRAWKETFGSQEQFFERFPSRQPSEDALRLEQLTPALGIVTEARHRTDGRPMRDARTATFAEIKREMMDYGMRQFGKSERGLDPAPEIVVAYLEQYEAELADVRELIVASGELHWELELERMFAAPIPNLLGHLDLAKLLAVDALVALEQGRRATALEDLDAIWLLSNALRRDPMLLNQLIAMVDLRMLTGILRQVPDAPEIWRERLAEQDHRSRFIEAMEVDAWIWAHAPMGGGFNTGKSALLENFTATVRGPYLKFCMAQASNALRERLQNLKQLPALCDYDLVSRDADLAIELPPWNILGNTMMPNLTSAVERVARLEFDLELTRHVLDLDAGLAQSANTSSSVRSEACPESGWIYDRSRPGQVVLSLDRALDWSQSLRGHKIPERFTLSQLESAARESI